MVISKTFKCKHCGGKAREYVGLEGGIYIDTFTPPECPKNRAKGIYKGRHRFIIVSRGNVI